MIVTRFQQSGSHKDRPRSGRPRCSTTRDDSVLLRLCRTDRKKTALELKRQGSEQSGVQCTIRNVRGRLLKHSFNSCIARKTPLVTEKQRRARRLWGKEHHHAVDTSTLGKDSMIRSVQLPAISNPSKCQSPKKTWGRICTFVHCRNC